MAGISQQAKPYQKPLTTWTKFHLPRDQEWPAWSADHEDVHIGPLKGVEGWRTASLGRMIDDPEQAAYIIQWVNLDVLKNFQSSPACADFLQNLPNHEDSDASIESGSALRELTLTDASSSSAPSTSRFQILEPTAPGEIAEISGRVTLTVFLIPHKFYDVSQMWKMRFINVFDTVIPPSGEHANLPSNPFYGLHHSAVWPWVLSGDGWVENKVGKLEQTQEGHQDRTILGFFHLWRPENGPTSRMEEASRTDPKLRTSWIRVVAKVMPPATSLVQEHWDIQDVPRFPESKRATEGDSKMTKRTEDP